MKKKKIFLISSGGGHFSEMLELDDMFLQYDYLLITEKTPFTSFYRDIYKIKFLKARPKGKFHGIHFHIVLFINFLLAIKLLIQHRPKVIISTGSQTAVPMCVVAKMLGIKIVFILSFARVKSKEVSASIIHPLADKFLVQWLPAKLNYENAIYLGGLF